jgi:Trk K+ transport system NAD-binding subunit
LHEAYALERCSVETSKSVIVNVHDDAETVKILLALAAYVKGKKLENPELRFVASLQDSQYIEAANIAGEGRAEIIYAKDAIARIISNTCRQHGLSQVLTELFNFNGNELYVEKAFPALVGKTFKEAALSFSNAVLVGLYADGKGQLNPPMDTVIRKKDQLVLLELDDGIYEYHSPGMADESKICNSSSAFAQASNHLVVLGSNGKLPFVLAEYAKYVNPGTGVIVVDDDLDREKLGTYENLEITICREPITRELLCKFLDRKANNILLLNDDSHDPETSDSQTLLRLILLRDIADKTDRRFAITTEMRSADNQRLASQARVDDFVIGSNFESLLMSQISEDPKIVPIITDLLDESGSELYMKPAADYVTIGVPVDSYTLTESAARKGEIYVGYRHIGDTNNDVVVNPLKTEMIVFGENDQLIVIAEN